MAYLSSANRTRVWHGLMRWWSERWETLGNLVKSDLLDAVVATDEWIDDNQGSYNQALPVAARTNLTTEHKTLLFCAVALARVNILMLRRVFGEVD